MYKEKLQVEDKRIAGWIVATLKGKKNIFAAYTPRQQLELGEFISALTYLLFGTEAVRNPASLIIHQMMLELIISGHKDWNFLSIFTTDNGKNSGGKMPMSQKRIDKLGIGAVDVSRFMHQVFQTTMKYSYDKAKIDPAFSYRRAAYDLLEKMINSEATVIKDWARKKNFDINDKSKFYEKLLEACEDWYGIIPMRQLIIDDINNFDFTEDDLGMISESPVKDLCTLREMFRYKDTEVKFLLEHGVSLNKIKEIYKKGVRKNTDWLKEIADGELWSIIEQQLEEADEIVDLIKKHGAVRIQDKIKKHGRDFYDHLSSSDSESSECSVSGSSSDN